ncbi:Protein POOR HOMOLOGOUS SYNAPSIS 1 [Linum grandiflorum]
MDSSIGPPKKYKNRSRTEHFFHFLFENYFPVNQKFRFMAGSISIVLPLNEEATKRSASAAEEWRWQVMFSRFVHFPTVPPSSHPLLTPVRAKRRRSARGVWISASSPTAILLLVDDRSCSDAIISVSLGGRVLEEHYVSKLHFSWPQVSCTPGYPTRGTRSVVVSYKDSAGLIQKFAFRFSSVPESESFIATLKDLLGYPAASTEPRASDPKSEISTHSAMMSTETPLSIDIGEESNTMSPVINTYSPELPLNISNEAQQDPVPEETSFTQLSNNNSNSNNISTLTMPPSFTSLLSNCCSEIQQASAPPTEVMKLPDNEHDLKTQIAKYMEDSSFQDMLFKVEKIFGEIGGDLIL